MMYVYHTGGVLSTKITFRGGPGRGAIHFGRYSAIPLCGLTPMGITQKEIADALDLPLITVHRALNNSGYVSKELKGRILAYAREVRYVPHKASQVLKRNKVRKIAVFSSSLPRYFWNDIRTGISIGAEQIQPLNYRVNYHMMRGTRTRTCTWRAWRRRFATAWRQSRSSTSGSTAWTRSSPASPERESRT